MSSGEVIQDMRVVRLLWKDVWGRMELSGIPVGIMSGKQWRTHFFSERRFDCQVSVDLGEELDELEMVASLAHEAGHIALGHGAVVCHRTWFGKVKPRRLSRAQYWELEYAADYAAGEAVGPEGLIRNLMFGKYTGRMNYLRSTLTHPSPRSRVLALRRAFPSTGSYDSVGAASVALEPAVSSL